jgi:hypothetical protein
MTTKRPTRNDDRKRATVNLTVDVPMDVEFSDARHVVGMDDLLALLRKCEIHSIQLESIQFIAAGEV